MKLKFFLACAIVVVSFACSNNKSKDKTDPTNLAVPTNSDATNPSLADTSNSKKDSITVKKDTLKR